jgi:hypothetical protein
VGARYIGTRTKVHGRHASVRVEKILHAADELVDLIVGKYGKRYDLTIARRTFAGKDFVSLNVMWCAVSPCALLVTHCSATR